MAIIKQRNKKTGVVCVYESESYWDPEKKQPRSRRKLIGKIDQVTGEIVPTGRPGPKPKIKETSPGITQKAKIENQKDQEIMDLKMRLAEKNSEIKILKEENKKLKESLSKILRLLDAASLFCKR